MILTDLYQKNEFIPEQINYDQLYARIANRVAVWL
jgi:hypothetical protein